MSVSHVGSFLIADPDPETAEILASLCRKIRKARTVERCEDALEIVAGDARLTGLIIEEDLPDGRGTKLLKELRSKRPMLPVLVLTANTSPDVINRAHRYRAEFHAKPTRRRSLLGFLRRAVAFERVPDHRISWLLEETVIRFKLSPRETDVLAAAIAGTSRKELSDQLGTSENTIKSVVKGALRKLPHASLDDAGREILRQALDGSHATTLQDLYEMRETPMLPGPPTIRPPTARDEEEE